MKLTLTTSVLLTAWAVSASDSPNRFTAAARLTFNAKASFGGIGELGGAASPGAATGGSVDRTYDDGYVRVDSEGNAAGLTWNWGYRDASQSPGDGTLSMHAASSGAVEHGALKDSPAPGFEVAWLRSLYTDDRWEVGFKLAFGHTRLEFQDSASAVSDATVLTDRYSLGGIVVPGDPGLPGWQYAGSFDGPGPLISDEPLDRTVSTASALTTGQRRLQTDIFQWKAGPWWEGTIFPRGRLHLGGGLAWSVMTADYRYDETTSIAGVGSVTRSGKGRDSGMVVGGYLEALVSLQVSERSRVFAGAEFHCLQSLGVHPANRPVELDLRATWALQTGFSFSF